MEKNNIEQLQWELPWKPRGSARVQLQPWGDGAGLHRDGSASLGMDQHPGKGRGSSQPSAGVLGAATCWWEQRAWSWVLPLLPGAVAILVTIITILSFSQPLMSSFVRLTSYRSSFTTAITQKKSQDFILSLNDGFIVCQVTPRLKATSCSRL